MGRAEKPFGELMRETRKAKGMTQRELGAYLGVTGAAISGIEKGTLNASKTLKSLFYERMGFSGQPLEAEPSAEDAITLEKIIATREKMGLGIEAEAWDDYFAENIRKKISEILPRTDGRFILLHEMATARAELGNPMGGDECEALARAELVDILTQSMLLRETLELRSDRELLATAKVNRQRWEAKAHGK